MVVKDELVISPSCNNVKTSKFVHREDMWSSTLAVGDNHVSWSELSSCRIDWFNNKSSETHTKQAVRDFHGNPSDDGSQCSTRGGVLCTMNGYITDGLYHLRMYCLI